MKLNGKIEVVESTIGDGTTFKLTIYKEEEEMDAEVFEETEGMIVSH